jgi:hypothetical protein
MKPIVMSVHLSEASYSEWFEARRCFITALINFPLDYAIRKVQETQRVEMNGTHQLLVYGGDVNLLGENINIM